VRELQRHPVDQAQQRGSHTASDGTAPWSRLYSPESRHTEISGLLAEPRNDAAAVIDHACDD
jgi:hypothetical protein